MGDLNGLNVNRPVRLTPPSELANKAQINAQQSAQPVAPVNQTQQKEVINVEALAKDTEQTKTTLSTNDNVKVSNMANMASSGVAGAIGAAMASQATSVVGESMRSVHVQNAMTNLQNNSSYGSGYSDYGNSYGNSYNNDYGATEFVRRRGYGRIEYSGNRAYVENGGLSSPEVRMGLSNAASGAVQGAKYGAIIGGAVSSVVNAYNVITGKSRGADAVGAVAADTATATISGAGGAFSGAMAAWGLGLVGVGGLPGIVLGTGIGAVGAIASQFLMTKTGIYDAIKSKVVGMIDGK